MTTWYQSFGRSLYLGGSIVSMKTMVATSDPIEVGASESERDEGKKSAIHNKSRDMVTSLEAKIT
ncbi:hypothetical protein PanWU01x14_328440 [Parasponia andersonii]|uniref:Uncharacterized protein n=1 Tax=Parasponia andersonii TaxID=3476 RepID=A0A2P5AIS3_PARAD|nr:hypothetical protein PanWU01x14_328440 [Parasponia andersonii]